MIELYDIGISEEDVNSILELYPEIKDLSLKDIEKKKAILENIGSSNDQIINIIGSNPKYLIRSNTDILNLINKLIDLGFRNLNILFDSNPYILDLDPFEVDNYINKRTSNNELLDDIIDDLDSNPYLFNEM